MKGTAGTRQHLQSQNRSKKTKNKTLVGGQKAKFQGPTNHPSKRPTNGHSGLYLKSTNCLSYIILNLHYFRTNEVKMTS